MAINKTINKSTKSHGAMRNCIEYALGDGGGQKGGKLIDASQYIESQRIDFPNKVLPCENLKRIQISSKVYDYRGINVEIACSRLNIISGPSGIGKSTLLREYFPQVFDNYLYINQKPLGGSVRSTVATSINIANIIVGGLAKEFNQSKSFFSNLSNAEGMCRACSGTGTLVYGSTSQSQIVLECKDCKGTGFDKKLYKYKWHGKSIHDIWKMTIDEGIDFFEKINQKIYNTLFISQQLLLGHLQIGEKTHNLSGGENIRLKLMTALTSKNMMIGIDEPFKGLNNEEIYKVILSLQKLVEQDKTIVVVDHEESSFKYFSKHIILTNIDGVLQEEN